MNSVRQILEIDKVLEDVKFYIKTKNGFNIISNLDVFESRELLEIELEKTKEMIDVINALNDLPIVSHIDIIEEINNCKKGSVLDEYKFNLIKEELLSIKEIIKFFNKLTVKPRYLSEQFLKLKFDESLYTKICNVITNENKVANSASPKLNELRHKIEKIERETKSTIAKLMITYKDQLSGDNYVLRDGVYVLPVNTSLKANVEGIVHDISDSGMTTFIEPSVIVNLENNKHILEFQEREEVTRILKELTYLVSTTSKAFSILLFEL